MRFAPPARVDEPNPAVDFELLAPQSFYTQRGILVSLVIEVGAPQPGRGGDGASLEAALLRNGEPVEGASARATLDPLLAPGTYAMVIPLAPPGTLFAEGDRIGIRVRPLMPLAPQHDMSLVVGKDGSRADFEALRLPGVADLGLAMRADQVVYHLTEEQFAPASADAQVITIELAHDLVSISALVAERERPLYVVIVTEEPTATAESEHEAFSAEGRRERAHRFTIGGDVALAYPGVGVATRARYEPEGLVVRCEKNCPPGGFLATIRFAEPPTRVPDQAGALIPPPAGEEERVPSPSPATPDTEAAPAQAPLPTALVLVAALGAALCVRRR